MVNTTWDCVKSTNFETRTIVYYDFVLAMPVKLKCCLFSVVVKSNDKNIKPSSSFIVLLLVLLIVRILK